MNRVSSFNYHKCTCTVKAVLYCNCFFFKSSRTCNNLKNRTRNVKLCYCLVFPLLLSCRHIRFVILFLCERFHHSSGFILCNKLIWVELRIKLHILRHLCNHLVGYITGVVKVKSRRSCHCKNSTCFCIHNYSACSVLDLEFAYCLLKIFFKGILKCSVNCQVNRITILRFVCFCISVRHFVSVSILCRNYLSVSTCKILVILSFNAILSVTVTICKADYRCCKFILRIVSFCILFNLDGIHILFVHKCSYFISNRFFNLCFQNLIL